jgi:hypothetical protein
MIDQAAAQVRGTAGGAILGILVKDHAPSTTVLAG